MLAVRSERIRASRVGRTPALVGVRLNSAAALGLGLPIAVRATNFPTRHIEGVRPARKGFVSRV